MGIRGGDCGFGVTVMFQLFGFISEVLFDGLPSYLEYLIVMT